MLNFPVSNLPPIIALGTFGSIAMMSFMDKPKQLPGGIGISILFGVLPSIAFEQAADALFSRSWSLLAPYSTTRLVVHMMIPVITLLGLRKILGENYFQALLMSPFNRFTGLIINLIEQPLQVFQRDSQSS